MRGFVPSAAKKMCGALPSRCRLCSRCRRDLPRQAPRGPCGGSRHRPANRGKCPRYTTVSGGNALSPPLFSEQLVVLGLLGRWLMLSSVWPRRCPFLALLSP
jgi:hypothetical protein